MAPGLEAERAMTQLDFWLELGELSQLGSAQLTNLKPASSAQFMSQKMSQIDQLIWLTNVKTNAAK